MGSRIRHVRTQRLGLTQRELADQLISANGKRPDPVNVSRWERDVSEPSLRYLRQIAALAELSVSYFFGEEEQRAA